MTYHIQTALGITAIRICQQQTVLLCQEEAGSNGIDTNAFPELSGTFICHIGRKVRYTCLGCRIATDATKWTECRHAGKIDDASLTLLNHRFEKFLRRDITPATITDGKLLINLRSGESRILKTSQTSINSLTSPNSFPSTLPITGPWTLTFTEETPQVTGTFHLDHLQTWEALSPEAAITMGTGVYTTTFRLTKQQARQHWMIDLGDVRESARVYLNGRFLGCAWAVPFVLDCRDALRKGTNELRIEVTNLPANRIADLDRKGIKWRKMNEINVVDINYKKTTYENWTPVKSGLNSEVKLYFKQK